MTDRRLLTVAIAMLGLAILLMPAIAYAQPADLPIAAAEPAPADMTPVVDGAVTPEPDKEVTPEEMGDQIKKTVKDWRVYGWLAGLAAAITLLLMVLKYKPVDKLFERWGVKWIKPIIAAVLGGASAGIASYLADGDVINAVVAGMLLVGPAAVGYFETANKVKARNRDNGKNGDKPVEKPQ